MYVLEAGQGDGLAQRTGPAKGAEAVEQRLGLQGDIVVAADNALADLGQALQHRNEQP